MFTSSLVILILNCFQSEEEYESFMNPYLANSSLSLALGRKRVTCNLKMKKRLPRKLNWLELGKVSSVKNQRHCSSCYIFTAVGALESQYLLVNRAYKTDLSEQAILNCLKNACRGGWTNQVWEYIIANGVTDALFAPYTARVRLTLACPQHLLTP